MMPSVDFDPEEIVQQPGQGPLTLRTAIARLPNGSVPATTMLNREAGKKPPFFNAEQVEKLRKLLQK